MAETVAFGSSSLCALPRLPRPLHRILAVLGIGASLAGCAPAMPLPPPGAVTVAPGVTLLLPPPITLQRSVEAEQLVTAHYNGQTFAFQMRISVTPARILVVGTDTLGQRGLTIAWDGTAMRIDVAPWTPSQVRPPNVLADIMLVHWPLPALRAALMPDATVEAPHPGERLVRQGTQDMIRINRLAGAAGGWTGKWVYRNLLWGYELTIDSVEVTP